MTGLDRSGGATIVIFERRGLDLLRRRLGKENARDAAMELVKKHGWGLSVLGEIQASLSITVMEV